MKNNKGLIWGIIIIVIVLIIGGFFGYKLYNLAKYHVNFDKKEYQEIIARLQIDKTINIKHETLKDSNYIIHDNMKIRNDFKDFEIIHSDEDSVFYQNEEENATIILTGLIESKVEELRKDQNFNLNEKEINEYFKKYDIENDADLIKFISSQKFKNNNIFTSVKNIKDNYFTHFITYLHMSVGDSITLITGDYEGYILNMADTKAVYIIKDNKTYSLTFNNTKYFTTEYINELLNTLIID